MKKLISAIFLSCLVSSFSPVSSFAATVGKPAPEFSGQGTDGKTYSLKALLADEKVKLVVLEWHNQGCPFVKKHYGSGNMQMLQKEATSKGVAWLTIISSATGKEGFVDAQQENTYLKDKKAVPTAAILDPSGTIGKLYGAKTTPHMFIISKKGELIYNGAIDDKPSTDPADIPNSKNYVAAALKEALDGKPVTVATTPAYGCSVKY